jgi:hypothetical protein
MKLISLDPGGTTGIAQAIFNPRRTHVGNICVDEFGPEHYKKLYKYLVGESPNVIIYERFLFQRRSQHVDLVSREYIGVIKLYAEMISDVSLAPQTASNAKGIWTDSKLKHLNLWVKGMPHGMDAVRHLLYFVDTKLGIKQYTNQLKDMK